MSDNDEMPRPRVALRLAAAAAAVTLLLVVGGWVISAWAGGASYHADLAALDEAEPGWRLDDVAACRAEVPDDDNSAPVVVGVRALLPRAWPGDEFHIEPAVLSAAPPRLDAPALAGLDRALADAGGAVPAARAPATMTRGRHKLNMTDWPWAVVIEDQPQARRVGELLRYDALRLATDGKYDDAIRSATAIVNAGRRIGDEPLVVTQLARASLVGLGLATAEQVMSLGVVGDVSPPAKILDDEAKHPYVLLGARSERAIQDAYFRGLVSGKLTLADILGNHARTHPMLTWRERWFGMSGESLRAQHLDSVRLMTRLVAIAKMPPHEQSRHEARLAMDADAASRRRLLMQTFQPAFAKYNETFRLTAARVEAMRVLPAAERFRRAKGRWPASARETVPDYLGAVPLDPMDGKELRYAKTATWAKAWSVGANRTDEGGTFDRANPTNSADVGFEGWDK